MNPKVIFDFLAAVAIATCVGVIFVLFNQILEIISGN